MGRHAVNSNMLFIDDYARARRATSSARSAAGSTNLLDGLNPERILIAGETIGIGRQAVSARHAPMRRTASCSAARSGMNQSIQHPLAQSWMELEAAWYATLQGRLALYDAWKTLPAPKRTWRSTSARKPASRPASAPS